MHPDIDEMLTAEAEGIMVWNETSNEFLMTTAKGRKMCIRDSPYPVRHEDITVFGDDHTFKAVKRLYQLHAVYHT